MAFYLKKGDLEPDLVLTLLDTARNPVDLTNATAATLRWVTPDGTVVSRPAAFGVRTLGKVIYAWLAGDTDDVGEYGGEVVITWANGDPETFPSSGFFVWEVTESLG